MGREEVEAVDDDAGHSEGGPRSAMLSDATDQEEEVDSA